MFFTHELLVGPKGQFALLWRAAVKKEKLKKRQLETLDVAEICKSLVEYMRPTADSRMGKIRGFSLRLSSQLVHGVIVCFNWKVAYILDEAQSSWKAVVAKRYLIQELSAPPKVKRARGGATVEENFQLSIDFDADPMFGQMLSVDLDDFPAIAPPHTTTEESTSASSPESAKKRRRVDKHRVADLGQITLQEEVPIVAGEGEDFFTRGEAVQFDLDELNAFADVPSLFDAGPSSKMPVATITRHPDATPSAAILPETPIVPRAPTRRGARGEESILAVPLQQDVSAMEVVAVPDAAMQEAPAETLAALEPSPLILGPLEGYTLPGRARKLRKLIVDTRIELKSEEMKKQLKIKYRTIQDYRNEGLLNEPINLVPANVLFSNATIHGTLFDTSRVEQERGDEATIRNLFNNTVVDISRDLEISRISGGQDQISGRRPNAVMEESSIQAARDASTVSGLAPDPAFEDSSVLRRSPRNGRGRSRRESSLATRDVSDVLLPPPMEDSRVDVPLPDILPEASLLDDEFRALGNDVLQMGTDQYTVTTVLGFDVDDIHILDGVGGLRLRSEVQNFWNEDRGVTFSELAPPGIMAKAVAARKFYALLACAKNRTVRLIQTGPFREIEIKEGFPDEY